jgi:hypothetical protein
MGRAPLPDNKPFFADSPNPLKRSFWVTQNIGIFVAFYFKSSPIKDACPSFVISPLFGV